MFCSVCGLEIKETDKVCPACGQPNENYVAPEGAEEAVAEAVVEEAAVAVAVEEVAQEVAEVVAEEAAEAVAEAPVEAPAKKNLAMPIVALALSGAAFLSFASGIIPLIMAIVARVLNKPYKKVTEKPVSIFAKITNILTIVTIILASFAFGIGSRTPRTEQGR